MYPCSMSTCQQLGTGRNVASRTGQSPSYHLTDGYREKLPRVSRVGTLLIGCRYRCVTQPMETFGETHNDNHGGSSVDSCAVRLCVRAGRRWWQRRRRGWWCERRRGWLRWQLILRHARLHFQRHDDDEQPRRPDRHPRRGRHWQFSQRYVPA